MDELDKTGINYKISSAVRFGKNTGGGSHGAGLAVDFNNLYQLVGGSIKAEPNLKARIEQPIYRQIAEIGAKYNWFKFIMIKIALFNRRKVNRKLILVNIRH